MDKIQRLRKLSGIVRKCGRCNLCLERRNAVFGEGNPHSRFMFIGEAPGMEEDQVGRPFVGRSGRLLRKMIQAINMDPVKDCYIANINKCRPPGNRTPEREEIDACLPFLKKQIEIIKPDLLILLGKTAVIGLLPDYVGWTVNSLRKSFKEIGSMSFLRIPVVVTFHPSALLRRPMWREPAKEDFTRLESLSKKRIPVLTEIADDSIPVESESLFK